MTENTEKLTDKDGGEISRTTIHVDSSEEAIFTIAERLPLKRLTAVTGSLLRLCLQRAWRGDKYE